MNRFVECIYNDLDFRLTFGEGVQGYGEISSDCRYDLIVIRHLSFLIFYNFNIWVNIDLRKCYLVYFSVILNDSPISNFK